MKRKDGFTLIELLVVIAIIALLLSIVIPAMAKAKDYVKRIICGNNAKQCVLAVNVYTQNNDQKIMPLYRVNGTSPAPLADIATDGPHNSYRAYHPDIRNQDGSLKAFHLGVLYEDGYIDTPEAFYCPAQPNSAAHYVIPFYYDFYLGKGQPYDYHASSPAAKGWGDFAPVDRRGGKGLVRTSFNYWTYGQQSLQKIGGYKPFIFDNIQDWRVVPHRKSRGMDAIPQGLSVAYADGHVSFCNDQTIFEDDAAGFPWRRNDCVNRSPDDVGQGPGNYPANFAEILRRVQGK